MSRSPLIRLHYRPDSIIARKDSASEFPHNPTLASPRAVRTGAPRPYHFPPRGGGPPRHSSPRASDGGRSAGENRVEGVLIRKGKCCEACSHPDRNPGRGDRRKLAHHPAERVTPPLRRLTALRLATDVVRHGQVATLCRRAAASPLNRPACPVRPRPPILEARPPASPGPTGAGAARVARLASARGFPLGWGHKDGVRLAPAKKTRARVKVIDRGATPTCPNPTARPVAPSGSAS